MAIDEAARRERDIRQLARARELMAQGVPYQQASEAAAREILAERRAAMPPPQDDPRAVAFESSMAEALGQDNLEAAASEIVPEPTVLYRTAPGRVSAATGQAEAGEDLYDPDAVAAYRTRVPTAEATEEQMDRARSMPLYRGGQFLPSPEDEDMYRRGQVYTVTPETGARGYSPAYPKDLPVGPGEPGRLGRRQDLEQPVIDSATGLPIEGTQKYVAQSADSPLGAQLVYRPSDEFRAQLYNRDAILRRERLMRAAGVSGEEADKLNLDQLRALGRSRREDDLAARKAEVTRRAMERQNPTALLNDEWRQYVMASRLLNRPAGASPTDVDKAHNEQLTALGLRVAQGQGFQQTTPEQQTALRNKVRADQMESDMSGVGSDDIRAGNLSSKPAQTEFRRLAREYDTGDESPVWWLPGVGGMSDANEQAFAEALQRDYGLSPQEAARVSRQYSNERRRVWPILGGDWGTRPPLPAQ